MTDEEKALKRFESTGDDIEIVSDKKEWEKKKKRAQEKINKILEGKSDGTANRS